MPRQSSLKQILILLHRIDLSLNNLNAEERIRALETRMKNNEGLAEGVDKKHRALAKYVKAKYIKEAKYVKKCTLKTKNTR